MVEWEAGSSSREVSILGTLFCQEAGKCLQVSAPDHQQPQGNSALGSTAKHETAQEKAENGVCSALHPSRGFQSQTGLESQEVFLSVTLTNRAGEQG